jgi:hypothetical protein
MVQDRSDRTMVVMPAQYRMMLWCVLAGVAYGALGLLSLVFVWWLPGLMMMFVGLVLLVAAVASVLTLCLVGKGLEFPV